MTRMHAEERVSPELQQRVLGQIDNDEVVRLASDLIRIPSFTTEETACAEWLANYLADQGLEVELQEIEPGRKQTIGRLRGPAAAGRSCSTATSTSIRSRPGGLAIPSAPGSPTGGSMGTGSTT